MTEIQIAERTIKVLTREERRQQFIESGWWAPIQYNTIPVHWLYEGEQRLDGGYYTQEVATALRIIKDCGFEARPLAKIVSEIFILGRFRRVYASDKKSGWPYLSASETLEFRPVSDRWIAEDHAPKQAGSHFVKRGWILVSASGSVGRPVLATKRLEKYFLTHDLLRIKPNVKPLCGYIYAYLSSWIGQALISKDQYGSAIKHLEPHHLSSVPVPLLPESEQQEIHDEIIRAYLLRDKANELLDKADELLHSELGLPRFNKSLVSYLPIPARPKTNRPEMPHPKAFNIKASELNERFDASYHVPVARTVVRLLHKSSAKPVQLKTLTDDIVVAPRFKRIYVQKEYGVPFLQGSHLPQMRPSDLKYLSRTRQKGLDRWIIRKGWVLITCSGTIGRIGLVSSYQDKWAASQHLLRIVPDYSKAHPGYIAAFLMTPYGQHQLTAKIYGGVVDELTEEDTEAVWISDAPKDIQTKIGNLVVSAFEKKDKANAIEEAAIFNLEEMLHRR